MKLTIQKEQLLAGLQAVQNIVGTRTPLPVLANVLVRGNGQRLELATTDLDISISCSVEATVADGGASTIPAKRFFAIARELPTPEIELEIDDRNACKIHSGAAYYKIHGMAADDFPPLPQFEEKTKVTLPQDKVRGMLRKTCYAVSMDEGRYVLNGIFVSIRDHKVTMVATDGRRLALAEEDIEVPADSQIEFIIPSKAINELNRLLQTTGEVDIRSSGNQASFTLRDEKGFTIVLTTKLVEGNYPNYRQVIPTDVKERVTLGREELLQALHRAEFMTSDKNNSVKINLTQNSLTITSNSQEVGEGRESITVNYSGKDISVAFNPGYLMDPLRVLEDDEVFLEVSDELSPGLLKVNGPFIYVLMPLRTN